ncbi:AT-rich interactive domain-containing protein 3A [Rhineura floridana]|uniref:AT-rich interactive domain-containing protein 3A n=1 Tax=Rhineura floridana TaxID=261503 RepID=UPI002AC8555A|nr:AT-rich interactive domain-containing protein 3A [Rhineura floridana]XP_061457607.1 AT-rich interactive domain-containing protein 3A [Rhineura floridana]XP_061457608.1 AT-rich interactive domain-containing protein 3A [Rhineura floridana]XP_061457609.1 AT-rich interactive domain-containing protein 3A [Rhineura floridana]
MKLQAVMENLQRQQRARLQQEMESRQQQQQHQPQAAPPPHQTAALPASMAAALSHSQEPPSAEEVGEPESARIQRAQMAALAAMRAAAAGLSQASTPVASEASQSSEEEEEEEEEEEGGCMFQREAGLEEEEMKGKWGDEEYEEDLGEEEDYDEMAEEGLGSGEVAHSSPGPPLLCKQQPPQQYRGEPSRLPAGPERLSSSVSHLPQMQPPPLDHGDWTYEEQFKQLYELDGDPKRKEFLDDLFSFMQKRGTPVNRIPIMAKQVLDLYMLYVLVTEKGGLVEVINKKLWREITKGLNLPTSITSAAFTLRTQYMKYLYPYECEKRGLSNPNELQAAIDSNRREGRRQGFSGSIFTYSPSGTHGILSSPKLQVPPLGLASATNGSSMIPLPKIKKEEDSAVPIAVPSRLPASLAGHPVITAQAVQAAAAAQAAALEQLREKLESGEPAEKKMALVTDEQQRLMQRAIQQNLLAMTAQLPMSIRINSQGTHSPENRQDAATNLATNGTNSISMSVEINGIVYTGVLFAQTPGPSSSLNKGNANSGRSSSGTGGGAGGSAPAGGAPSGLQAGLPSAPTSTSTNSASP